MGGGAFQKLCGRLGKTTTSTQQPVGVSGRWRRTDGRTDGRTEGWKDGTRHLKTEVSVQNFLHAQVQLAHEIVNMHNLQSAQI